MKWITRLFQRKKFKGHRIWKAYGWAVSDLSKECYTEEFYIELPFATFDHYNALFWARRNLKPKTSRGDYFAFYNIPDKSFWRFNITIER